MAFATRGSAGAPPCPPRDPGPAMIETGGAVDAEAGGLGGRRPSRAVRPRPDSAYCRNAIVQTRPVGKWFSSASRRRSQVTWPAMSLDPKSSSAGRDRRSCTRPSVAESAPCSTELVASSWRSRLGETTCPGAEADHSPGPPRVQLVDRSAERMDAGEDRREPPQAPAPQRDGVSMSGGVLECRAPPRSAARPGVARKFPISPAPRQCPRRRTGRAAACPRPTA